MRTKSFCGLKVAPVRPSLLSSEKLKVCTRMVGSFEHPRSRCEPDPLRNSILCQDMRQYLISSEHVFLLWRTWEQSFKVFDIYRSCRV